MQQNELTRNNLLQTSGNKLASFAIHKCLSIIYILSSCNGIMTKLPLSPLMQYITPQILVYLPSHDQEDRYTNPPSDHAPSTLGQMTMWLGMFHSCYLNRPTLMDDDDDDDPISHPVQVQTYVRSFVRPSAKFLTQTSTYLSAGRAHIFCCRKSAITYATWSIHVYEMWNHPPKTIQHDLLETTQTK